MRNAFGLRTEFPVSHVSGSGPDAQEYRPPRGGASLGKEGGEECVLLSKTDASVRGFLALARKEAEAGWQVA